VAVLPYLEEMKIPQASDMLGRPLEHHHPDQRHRIPDSVASKGKDDGCPSGETGTIPGGYSGQVALTREQCNVTPLPLVMRRSSRPVMSYKLLALATDRESARRF
jgi:hypothetical protein